MYYIRGHGWFDILDSARKHGVSDEAMCHAIGQAMVVLTVDEGYRGRAMHLGPDAAGRLLEVVTVASTVGTQVIIHAMPMRRKFLRFFNEG